MTAREHDPALDAPPTSELELLVLETFRTVVGDPHLGLADDFFIAGGHSLLAVQAETRLTNALGVEIPAGLLFLSPTAAELAAAVADLLEDRDDDAER